VDRLLAEGTEVIAPVRNDRDLVELTPIESSDGLAGEYLNVNLPLKRLFFPETEVLVDFERLEDGDIEVRGAPAAAESEMMVLGSRPCDAAALDVLDKVFTWDYEDLRYSQRRERATVVSFACNEPDERCFCTAVGGSPRGTQGSDILAVTAEDGSSSLLVLTPKGEGLVEKLAGIIKPGSPGKMPPAGPEVEACFDPEKVKLWLDANFESEYWTDASLRCVGCGACSYLCPTCHCFDIVDEGMWNRGERRRNWDCCSFGAFTLHASGHNPRPSQAARYRQRVMHKFKYFPERFGLIACVGCGRCVRTCGVGQDLVSVLTGIEKRKGEVEP
jgi:ferredoxin